MPELPEVETVRRGLERWVAGRTLSEVEIRHPRAVRRHLPGAAELSARLIGARIGSPARRGKFLWLPLSGGAENMRPSPGAGGACLVVHLGMSGQLLVQPPGTPDERHLHIRFRFDDGGSELRFVDQRTFGGVLPDTLVPAGDGAGDLVPATVAHIARDPVDPAFEDAAFVRRLRRRDSAIKRALLDQTLISGIGNIYADEALWRARLHGGRPARLATTAQATALLGQVREVLAESLAAGGTSFDALYVNVNGQSGYFTRALAVYGQEGRPCPRCGTAIRRLAFMNRSSFFCPSCQRPPRVRRTG
jgi:formamidopyrimidine-DNA glycosylase